MELPKSITFQYKNSFITLEPTDTENHVENLAEWLREVAIHLEDTYANDARRDAYARLRLRSPLAKKA